MPLNAAMSAMSAAELALWAALAILFWSKGLHRRFTAMGYYLALRAISSPILMLVLYEDSQAVGNQTHHLGTIYYFGFFATYLASTVLLFFICIEVFRSALAAFPGIAKLAIVIFRWAAVVSMHREPDFDFLCAQGNLHYRGHILWADALGERSRAVPARLPLPEHECPATYGARSCLWHCIGLRIVVLRRFIIASWISRVASLSDPLQFVYESLILATLAIWMVYCILPEPARKPVLDAGEFDHLPVERNRFGTGPHGHQGGRAAARQQLLPLGCGAGGGEGAGAEHEGTGVGDVKTEIR